MKKLIIKTIVRIAGIWKLLSIKNDFLMKLNFLPGLESWRWNLGKWRTIVQFEKAKKEVPAYAAFIENTDAHISFNGIKANLEAIPVMDKTSYVNKYGINERCIGGKIPSQGVLVDESSGSSGKPSSWVRGNYERALNKKMIQFGIKQVFGEDNLFIINAFAMGAWATGVNVTMSCVDISILKSLGPDQQKIINTLQDFGPNYRYIIMGYPPFLKILVDQASINWEEFDIHFIFGGEAMSEVLRQHLLKKGIKTVRSSLGASDLELNLALENDFTMELRRKLIQYPNFAKELLKVEGTCPMIFQYNPADFFMETNLENELIVSIARDGYIAPKIRYNIHDRAQIVRKKDLIKALEKCGMSLDSFYAPMQLDLPILLHFGRADMTVSYFGANITPNDVNDSLCQINSLDSKFAAFKIYPYEDKNANKQLKVFVELYPELKASDFDTKLIQTNFLKALCLNNQDFREAYAMMPDTSHPEIVLCKQGHDIFEDNDIRIKLNYISGKPKHYFLHPSSWNLQRGTRRV